MENKSSSLASKIMSILFIAMGVFLGIYAFVAKADTRTLDGWSVLRNNATGYLDSTFRNDSPSSGDIITALYGSWDNGSIYTHNWENYNQSTCLDAWMNVEYTSDLTSNPIMNNTIYVVTSWTYDIGHEIVLQDCSAIVSSGMVILSGNGLWASPLMKGIAANNIILQNIRINANTDQSHGLSLEWWESITIKDFQSYADQHTDWYGIYLSWNYFVDIIDTQLYDNYHGILGKSVNSFIYLTNVQTRNNNKSGIYWSYTRSIFSWITSYNNLYGMYLLGSRDVTIDNAMFYNNSSYGFMLQDSNTIHLTDIDSYDNTWSNIYLSNTSGNILNNITANNSKQSVWLDISISSWDTLSGLVISGNHISGMNLTEINNISLNNLNISNSMYLMQLTNSTWVILNNLYLHDIIDDGEWWSYGISVNDSHNLKLTDSIITNNYGFWAMYVKATSDAIISWCQFLWNVRWIDISYSHNIDFSHSYMNHGNIQFLWWTWQDFSYFSGNNTIQFSHFSGNSATDVNSPLYYTFDTYTRANNTIVFDWEPHVTLTWIVTSGTNFPLDFNVMTIWHTNQDRIALSWVQSLNISHDDWNWLFIWVNTITSGSKQANTGENWMSLIAKILWTIEVGSNDNSTLSMNWWYATIYYSGTNSRWWTSWQHLTILSSYDGEHWIRSSSTWCIVTQYYKCNFSATWDIKLFAFGLSSFFLFTGTSFSGDIIHDGWLYNTWVSIAYSWLYLIGWSPTLDSSTYNSGDPITGDWTHIFLMQDIWGNSTGMTFTIDTISPSFTWITQSWTLIVSWWIYNTWVSIIFSDLHLSGATLDGNSYTGWTLITGHGTHVFYVYDVLGNSTGITFSIDTIPPQFTWYTMDGTIIISGGYYNTGIRITFYDPNISWATLNGTLYNSWDLISLQSWYTFLVSDVVGNSTGITFTIDTTNPLVTGIYPASGLNITWTNDITFLRSGSDNTIMSWYTLYVTGTEIHTYTTTNTGYTITGLDNGTYTWYIVATDIAGNTWASAMATFRISTPLNATATLTGGNMIQIWSTRYTRLDATFGLRANQPCRYTITGAYLDTFSGEYIGDMILSRSLTGSDWDKVIYITFSTWTETPVTITKIVKLDTTTYAPTLLSPLTGTSVGGTVELRWNHSSIPESVGRSGYRYYLSYTGTFSSLITSWTVSDTVTGVNISSGLTHTGIVYRYVEAVDKLWNTSGSAISSFIYDTTADTTPNNFSFNDVTDARLDRVYISNTLTITGMTAWVNVLASINRWALYINDNFVGTTWLVQSWSRVKVELTSSDDYDETVSSTLTINGVSDTFSVTTMEEDEDDGTDYEDIDTNLSNTEKLMIIAVFETLRDLYAGDKEEEFFNTFMLMLEEKMDDFDDNDNEYDALKYLYDLVEQYYEDGDFGDNVGTTPRIINNIYTAPNGKKYTITYDSSKQRFTSTNFVVPKYFPTLDTLKYIIDINNPVGTKYANAKPILARRKHASIDGTWQSSPYTAPNKKAFYFFKTIDERYSSYTFTSERYFNSLLDVKEFINSTNK